jgi:hypothetical protein
MTNVSTKLNNHIEQRSQCELEQLERIRQYELEKHRNNKQEKIIPACTESQIKDE